MEFMSFLNASVRSLLKNKMRSFLTMLGIIIGISSVIVMVSIGSGASKQIKDQISSMGVNMITVFPASLQQGGVRMGGGTGSTLEMEDVDALKKRGKYISAVTPIVRAPGQLVGPDGNWSSSVQGVSPDYLSIRQWTIRSGVMFSDSDVKRNAKVCVIGQTVSSNLFGTDDPLGKNIRVGKTPFIVVGVLSEKGFSGMGNDQDDVVLAPYTTVINRLSRTKYLDIIQVSASSENDMDSAQDEVRTILRETHNIGSGEDDPFTVRNQSDIVSTATQTTSILTAFLAAVAGISLLVGGIGIMNIMLVSVTERTREIGIRLAVGAHEMDILLQFLVEAVVLCVSGGMIGIGLGFIIGFAVQAFAGWAVSFQAQTIILAFGFSFLVGLFFGFYPARQASRLNPIEALRYE